ncbi:hypothetical protein MBLNU459_g4885t2 [Dothideomycetes sp. NU459]
MLVGRRVCCRRCEKIDIRGLRRQQQLAAWEGGKEEEEEEEGEEEEEEEGEWEDENDEDDDDHDDDETAPSGLNSLYAHAAGDEYDLVDPSNVQPGRRPHEAAPGPDHDPRPSDLVLGSPEPFGGRVCALLDRELEVGRPVGRRPAFARRRGDGEPAGLAQAWEEDVEPLTREELYWSGARVKIVDCWMMVGTVLATFMPPRDSSSIAKRVLDASSKPASKDRTTPLYFLDLNAVSPRSARETAELLRPAAGRIRFIDGGIIGGPPRKKPDGPAAELESWTRPSIPVSGPHALNDAEPSGAHLAAVLNMKHISKEIGPASGLKMSFASLTKGMTALAIQSFTTAHRLNVLPELQEHLRLHSPKTLELAEKGVVGMPPKAYRWVREMEEIANTFAEDGGFDADESIFSGVSKTYELVAYGTELGAEKTETRIKGKTAESVAELMSKGIDQRKLKRE